MSLRDIQPEKPSVGSKRTIDDEFDLRNPPNKKLAVDEFEKEAILEKLDDDEEVNELPFMFFPFDFKLIVYEYVA